MCHNPLKFGCCGCGCFCCFYFYFCYCFCFCCCCCCFCCFRCCCCWYCRDEQNFGLKLCIPSITVSLSVSSFETKIANIQSQSQNLRLFCTVSVSNFETKIQIFWRILKYQNDNYIDFCPALTKLALDLHVNFCMSVCFPVFFSRLLIGLKGLSHEDISWHIWRKNSQKHNEHGENCEKYCFCPYF